MFILDCKLANATNTSSTRISTVTRRQLSRVVALCHVFCTEINVSVISSSLIKYKKRGNTVTANITSVKININKLKSQH